MAEQEPRAGTEVIIEAPYEEGVGLGRSAIAGATLDLDVDRVIASMELMLAIQEDLPYIEIKEEQVECLDALQNTRDKGIDKALIQMATGTGKTTVAVADAKRFMAEHPGSRVLFLSHQNRIGDQGRERFESILGENYTYGTFTGEEQDFHEVDCLFASFQVMHHWREAFLENEFDYIIVDEAHHSKAETYEPTIEYFKPKFLLAMTATPDRHDMKDIRELFGPEVYKLTLEEAIARNLLSYVDYHVMLDEIAAENILRDPETRAKLNVKQLNRTVFMPKRDEEIARLCVEKGEELGQPVRRLVFCKSVEQTEELAQYYEKAEPIHNKLLPYQIKAILERYRAGEIKTLLTVDMFNEGIDVPEVNQVVFMRLTDSVTVFLQQLGRGLRKLGDKEKVQVLDFVANCDRLAMLDSLWKRIVANVPGEDGDGGEVFRINGGEFHFSDTTREILTILNEIDANRLSHRNWSREDSISLYTRLSTMLKRPASRKEIDEYHRKTGTPYVGKILRDFDGSIAELQKACGMESLFATADDYSYSRISEETGVAKRSIPTIVRNLGLSATKKLSSEGRWLSFYTADDKDVIARTFFSYDEAPSDAQSVVEIANELGVARATLLTRAEALGINATYYRFGNRLKLSIAGKQKEALIKGIEDFVTTPESAESIKSVYSFAHELGTTKGILLPILKQHGVVPASYRFKKGAATLGLTQDQQDFIRTLPEIAELPPEDVISVNVFAKELGIAFQTLKNIIEDEEIELPNYKFGPKVSGGLNPAMQQTIRGLESVKRLQTPEAPEGVKSLKRFAQDSGIDVRKISKYLAETKIKLPKYKFNNMVTGGLSVELQEKIIAELD